MRRTLGVFAAAWIVCAVANVAHAETIRGTFTYQDSGGAIRPIMGAEVGIWQQAFGGSITWARTNSSGQINEPIPFLGPGTRISLRIYAKNQAVDVPVKDHYSGTFFQQTAEKTSTSASDVHDFSFHFTDFWASRYYNVANVALRGREYAEARRDPRESDQIEPVSVHISSTTPTFTDPVSKVIHLDDDFMDNDLTILHEYAHVLEHQISSFAGWGAPHDGCNTFYDPPRYAWMEGFADYFAFAVAIMTPGAIDGSPSDMAPESPEVACPGATRPFLNIENFVAAALRDLIDSARSSEPGDRMCSVSTGIPNDVRIFQIFDRELEIGLNNPRLQDFVNGWIGRGFDLPSLLKAFGPIASELVLPAPTIRYDSNTMAANKAVWRPSTGQWWVIGSSFPSTQQWGQTNDIPVPADYDGDGFTDVAIWRPLDGNWWVILSATDAVQVQQWGTNGDIPLPADYDGDGEVDFAVYRPSTSTLFVFDDKCSGGSARFPGAGTPFVGDFDGDKRADPGIYDFQTGNFRISLSTTSTPLTGNLGSGWVFSQVVVGDFDGDKRADVGRFHGQTATWSIRLSSTGQTIVRSFGTVPGRGRSFDRAVPADYDGDGVTDLATWTPDDGTGYAVFHINGQPDQRWGVSTDTPVPAP